MAKTSIDRRVARTRTSLHQALLSLIAETGYDATTVEDLCARANIGRSTFYAHYTSKDDLLRSGLEELRNLLPDRERKTSMNSGPRGFAFSLPMLKHAQAHAHLHGALLGNRGGTIVLDTVLGVITGFVRGELAARAHGENAVPRELVVQYVVGAYMAVVTWWLDRVTRLPPERIDAMFQGLATDGVPPALS